MSRITTARVAWLIVFSLLATVGHLRGQVRSGLRTPSLSMANYEFLTNFDYQEPVLRDGTPGAEPQPYRSRPLTHDRALADALSDPLYVNTVGGVAFDKVAQPAANLEIEDLQLEFDGGRSKARVRLNGRTYPLDLPVWQLVPIARYADSPYFATVSLFGKLAEGLTAPPNAKYVVAYHPQLENTLLGLRLFQSDYLLLDPGATFDLPRARPGVSRAFQKGRAARDSNGPGLYLLGEGEAAPAPEQRAAMASLSRFLADGDAFTSYVICDSGVTPEFSIQSRQFRITGWPYFHFWTRGEPVTVVVEEPERVVNVRTHKVVHVEGLSNQISAQVELLHAANPAVYDAMTKTMRYAALFRYYKNRDPDGWTEFLKSLDRVKEDRYWAPTPVVVTHAG